MRIREMVSDSLENPRTSRMAPSGVSNAIWGDVSEKLREAILDAIAQREWPVLMFGPTGRGKTCAMACVYLALPERFMALWFDTGELLQRLMECRKSKTGNITRYTQDGVAITESEFDIKRKVNDAHYVFFDDVGVIDPSEAKRGAFEEIINLREGKPTFYSSNKNEDELAVVYDMRIVSRLFSGTPLEVRSGVDRRLCNTKIKEV